MMCFPFLAIAISRLSSSLCRHLDGRPQGRLTWQYTLGCYWEHPMKLLHDDDDDVQNDEESDEEEDKGNNVDEDAGGHILRNRK